MDAITRDQYKAEAGSDIDAEDGGSSPRQHVLQTVTAWSEGIEDEEVAVQVQAPPSRVDSVSPAGASDLLLSTSTTPTL